jgi:metal-sulfur cluster biosynthetic enzyme/nitrite reductase/ring-hydroxylating ferredoxin subunit
MEQVATLSELKEAGQLIVEIDDYPALLALIDGKVYAVEDTCSHDQQPLGDAKIEGNEITCPRHGARFDVTTGEALCMPATGAIQTFDIEVRGENIFAGPKGSASSTSTSGTETKATPLPIASSVPSLPAVPQDVDTGPVLDQESTDVQLIEALKQVIDPELMINIVDLGLIYNVEQQDEGKVAVDMTLTSPACPAGPQIIQQSKMALERLDAVTEAEIKLTMTPPWTPERMTDDARDQLGIF